MKVAVVGGGISGVSIASLLKKHTNYDIVLIEKDKQIGGKASTIRENGYLIEKGPNGFLDNKEEIKSLISEFCFEDNVIESKDASRRRFIFSNGKLYELPNNPIKMLFEDFLSIKGRLRIAKEPFIKPNLKDETLKSFVERRLGREVLDKLIGPMACGVYAGDPAYMSMDATFARIKEIERRYGSLIKGLIALMREKKAKSSSASGPLSAKLLSFKNGVGSFIEHLAQGVNIVNDKVISIKKIDEKYRLILSKRFIDIDIVVFALPSYALSEVIQGIDHDFAKTLKGIKYASLSSVSFGFDKKEMPDIVNSFGYLFNLNDIVDTIGVLFDSSIFDYRAAEDKVLVRAMVGGSLRNDSALRDNIVEIAIKEFQRSANIFRPFEFTHKEAYKNAIPQYGLNHKQILDAVSDFEKQNRGIFITGNAFYGVSLNDCIKSSYMSLQKLI
jgi:oxygen-dependent protoporphyrinogen oxidase